MRYSPEEDRILLRLNTDNDEEFRFWLTRRYASLLGKALGAHRAADPDVSMLATAQERQAVQEFKREDADQKGNFEESFKQSSDFPLGEVPILAYKLAYKVDGSNLNISIEPKSGAGIKIVLNPQLNFNVGKLLRQASDQAQWGLMLDAEPAPAETDRVVN